MRLLTTALLCTFAAFYNLDNSWAEKKTEQAKSTQLKLSVDETADADAGEIVAEDIATEMPEKIEIAESAAAAEIAESSKEINLDDMKKKSESEIPVFTNLPKEKKEASSPYFRLVMSLGIIGFVCLGAYFFSKWWKKNYNTQPETNRIRVMNQHFLGPKKSLAIVRVAGESILIGITENNISHIRTLSLLDEEDADTETVSRKSFDVALQDQGYQMQDGEEFAFGSIQDRITRGQI